MSTVKTLSLGDRMKLYERALDTKLNPCMNYMIRLDGKNFSKLTRRWKLQKPFDAKFNIAMNSASKALIRLIPNVKLVWHGSDEISVWFIFPDVGNPFFDGRIQKIISLASSAASVAFNKKLCQLLPNTNLEDGIFDARIMQFPNEVEAANCFIFRQRDGIRNSISMCADYVIPKSQLFGKNSDEKKAMLSSANHCWEDEPDWVKFGTFITKYTFEVTSETNNKYIRTKWDNYFKKIENVKDIEEIYNLQKNVTEISENQWNIYKGE